MPKNQMTEYRTKDLGEVTMLVVKKQKLLRMEKESFTAWFVFEDQETCIKLSDQFFYGNDVPVGAREYSETMNRLKNRIFAK